MEYYRRFPIDKRVLFRVKLFSPTSYVNFFPFPGKTSSFIVNALGVISSTVKSIIT